MIIVVGADPPVGTLTGSLDPRSDTGVSHTDGITRDNTPTFLGTAAPGAIVTLSATPKGGVAMLLGRAAADAAGNWTIDAPLIADGSYLVTANAVGGDGPTASAALRTVVIDTVGPHVTAQWNRSNGRIVLRFRDGRSGLDGRSLIDGSNYAFSKANSRPEQFLITRLAATQTSDLTAMVVATVNSGRRLRGGFYTLRVRSGGVQDVAGNSLDGKFFGTFPSGNGSPGGDFVARLVSVRNIIFAPAPVDSTVSPLVPRGAAGRSPLIPGTSAFRDYRLRLARAWDSWRERHAAVIAPAQAVRHPARPGTAVRSFRAGNL
jgi:hypothetical protein